MRYLKTYKLFENVQQSESYVNKNPDLKEFFSELKKSLIGKWKNSMFTFLAFYDFLRTDEVMEYLYKIVDNKLDINLNDKSVNPAPITKWNRASDEEKKMEIQKKFSKLKEMVDFSLLKRPTMKFIEKYVPGFLKREMKLPENIKRLGELSPWEIDESKLRGMVSLFNNADEYISFIEKLSSDSIESLKNSDADIIEETDEYIIYKPNSFESMNCIIFNNWCTIDTKEYDKYINAGYKLWVYYDKNDITNSYMLLSRDDDFYVSDYNNDTLFTDEDYEDMIDDIPKETFKLVDVVSKIDSDLDNLIPDYMK